MGPTQPPVFKGYQGHFPRPYSSWRVRLIPDLYQLPWLINLTAYNFVLLYALMLCIVEADTNTPALEHTLGRRSLLSFTLLFVDLSLG